MKQNIDGKFTETQTGKINKPKFIIVHCSASEFGTVEMIRAWHLDRGFNDIGYHYVILNGQPEKGKFFPGHDGKIEVGRPEDEIGAHCLGFNKISIGICCVGDKDFTNDQRQSLRALVKKLMFQYSIPPADVLGHCETDSGKAEGKTCPNMDMNHLRAL